jgi:hypothetical protein
MRNEEEFAALEAENRRLRDLLERHGISRDPPAGSAFSKDEKIRLFRSLFRGREDVYAIRWERADNRQNRSR